MARNSTKQKNKMGVSINSAHPQKNTKHKIQKKIKKNIYISKIPNNNAPHTYNSHNKTGGKLIFILNLEAYYVTKYTRNHEYLR